MMFSIAYINNPEEAVTGRENREIRVPLRIPCPAQYTHKKPRRISIQKRTLQIAKKCSPEGFGVKKEK